MNTKKLMPAANHPRVSRTALAVAIAIGFGLSGQVFAQSTTGSIFGTAPTATGETVKVVNNQTGLSREVAVDSAGRYTVSSLPIGSYSVSLMKGGNVLASQQQVAVSVSGGTQVPFTTASGSKNVENLTGVTVTANALPPIDVSATRESHVITAAQLKVLPLGRTAEDIALLAPGTASGGAILGKGPSGTPLVSFSGNSVVENAYYVNGFNTTDPVGNAGGVALPYFAIAEQQSITAGYGAEFGRSTGGVISQIGQRGGNDFHAGVYAAWAPSWAQGNYDNYHYANPLSVTPGKMAGDLNANRQLNSSWSTIYDAYVSGPLIKDKLFFYLTAEAEHDSDTRTGSITAPHVYSSDTRLPKLYGKLDWNINDSNILELTGIQTKYLTQSDNVYAYNYATSQQGDFQAANNPLASSKFKIGILKYTSYITDNLSLSVLYGKMKSTYFTQNMAYPGYDPTIAGVANVGLQNHDVPGYGSDNTNALTLPNADHKSTQSNFRLDLNWKLGDHDLKFGIDNVRSTDIKDETVSAGPGYYWNYGQEPSLDPTAPLVSGSGAGGGSVPNTVGFPNGATGFYVDQVHYANGGTFTVQQKAQYVEDNWQVTPNILLNLGLRNDQFTNYDGNNNPYVRETSPQWAPRLGFSWDIFGDSSAKLYANVGRYYLALPSGLAVRMASTSTFTDQYYTYSGIDANGIPQGTTRIPATVEPFSADGEIGTARDPKTIAATDLKPEYQDEFVLGFQKTLGDTGLVWTNQGTYSKMHDIVDDTGATLMPADADGSFNGDILVNPGRVNSIRYMTTSGQYSHYKWDPKTATDGFVTGFPAAYRNYYSLEEALEHPWDGKWMGKIDYVFSKSYGTTEGPTQSATHQISSGQPGGGGQSGSITTAWDYPALMQYSNGEQPNSHRHTFKAYGSYAITPEWLVGGLFIVQSGAPITCLGYFGAGQEDPGYGQNYHWCGGVPAAPGAVGNTPWTHQLNLSVSYTPEWASKHLTFQAQVHNVFNEQKITQYYDFYGSTLPGAKPNPSYKLPWGIEQPRYVQLSVRYEL
ncbi:MAG: TonB-dependent receptor [Rhodanobacter sp.]